MKYKHLSPPKYIWFKILTLAGLNFCFSYEFALYSIRDKVFKKPKWIGNYLLIKACYYGNVDIYVKAIDMGAKNLNYGLYYACKGGQLAFVKYLINEPLTSIYKDKNRVKNVKIACYERCSNVSYGLYAACKAGHITIVCYIVKKFVCDYELGLLGASKGGHIKILEAMLILGAKMIGRAFYNVCKYGHKHMVEFFKNKNVSNHNNCLYIAHYNSHFDVVKKLLEIHEFKPRVLRRFKLN